MKHMTIEVYLKPGSSDPCEAALFRSTPAFGDSHEPHPESRHQRVTLNNGEVRVKVGVYNGTLTLDEIKAIARHALTAKSEAW